MGKRKATGAVPSDWTGQAKVFGSTIKENVDVLAGHNGDPLDKAVTGRDLIDAGVAQIAAVGTGGSSPLGYQQPTTQIPTYSAPPIVTGLEASGAFTIILLTWDMPVYVGFAYWEIWRNVNDDLANATLHATTTQLAGNYPDAVGSEKTYYYWVRGVNFNNVKGPFNGTAGTVGNTQADVATILELLEDGITTSQLASDLATPLSNLPPNTNSTIATMQGQISQFSSGYVNPDGTSGTVTLQQAMTTQASVNGDLKGQYSVKIDTNGHVAGFGLSSTLVDDTPTSAFIIRADKFALVSSSDTSDGLGTITPDSDNVPFFVHSDGKTYIKNAQIIDGSITNAKIVDATIDGELKVRNINADFIETGTIDASKVSLQGVDPNFSIKSSASGARLEIKAANIKAFDSAGQVRVILGAL